MVRTARISFFPWALNPSAKRESECLAERNWFYSEIILSNATDKADKYTRVSLIVELIAIGVSIWFSLKWNLPWNPFLSAYYS